MIPSHCVCVVVVFTLLPPPPVKVGDGGFVWRATSEANLTALVGRLSSIGWVDKATRYVFADVTYFNVVYNQVGAFAWKALNHVHPVTAQPPLCCVCFDPSDFPSLFHQFVSVRLGFEFLPTGRVQPIPQVPTTAQYDAVM